MGLSAIGGLAAATLVTLLAGQAEDAQGSRLLPPRQPRTAPNLISNGTFKGAGSWALTGKAIHDPSRTHTPDGSGSVRLEAHNKDFAFSGLIPVQEGKTYTYAYYMKVEGWPTLGGMQVKAFDGNKKAIRNIAFDRTGVSREGVWEENVLTFTVPPGIHFVHLQIIKMESTRPGGRIWVDDAYLGEGVGVNELASPKKPFDGALTRVDALGNIEIRKKGVWTPFFPLAIYSDNGRDRSIYSKQGWNMDMWAGGMFIKQAVEAKSDFNPDGMYVGLDISGHLFPKSWRAYGDAEAVKKRIRAFQAAGYSDHVVLYYWDNENAHDEWEVPKRVIKAIREIDRDSKGKVNRPVYALQGTFNVARTHATEGIVDVTGTYFGGSADATGGAAAGLQHALSLIQRMEGQTNPVSIAQFNGVTGAGEMRQRLYHAIILGAKGMGYWRDYEGPDPVQNKIAGSALKKPWWPDFPNLRREVDTLIPLIRTPHWTSWTATATSGSGWVLGTRDLEKEGYLFLINTSDKPQTGTIRVEGLKYVPRQVTDYFTGKKVCDIRDGSFTVTLPGIHVGKGTAVYRLSRE